MCLLVPTTARGETSAPDAAGRGAEPAQRLVVDRAVVRFSAPEVGGIRAPRFIFERELAFEARLEALTDADFARHSERPYLERHVQAALERSIAETLLSSLRVEPAATEAEIEQQATLARRILLDRIGGAEVLEQAARAEGMNEGELLSLFRRRARAGLYLDRMVAPMLTPTSAELRQVYASEPHPYRSVSYDEALPLLTRWVIGRRLREAFEQYYQNARQRLEIVLLTR
ncbi:MAG: hypothetical protein QM784_30735 [Polyangiaceae bacterium]